MKTRAAHPHQEFRGVPPPPPPGHHPTIKFTAEISEITFLGTVVYKGNRFITESVLDVRTHYKATETFQYTHFSSCHPPGVKRGFIEGEALRLLRTNPTKATFEEKNQTFRITSYREGLSKKSSAENSLRSDFQLRIENRPFNKNQENLAQFVTQYHPSVTKLKQILMANWHLIER